MAVQQRDIARTLRPFTLHAQQVMAQARADAERVPAVLLLVQRALDHAGLADTFRLLPDLDAESAPRGAKSYPETSAQFVLAAPCSPPHQGMDQRASAELRRCPRTQGRPADGSQAATDVVGARPACRDYRVWTSG